MNYGIIVAGGRSERMGAKVDKAFLSLGPRPVLAYSLMAFEECLDIDGVILVLRKDRVKAGRSVVDMFGCAKVKAVVAGGPIRQVSVQNGMDELPEDAKIVAVHDGARPCVTPALISETIKSAKRYGSGVAAVRIADTVKHVERGLTVTRTVDRSKLWAVQTPQTFKVSLLKRAFELVKEKNATITDESSAVELTSQKVRLVQATVANVKITTPDDLAMATTLLNLHRNFVP
ncbi:MAG: 2-C-methyl-D-erythritol 4-phosphate cytidylyltransferase [Kiritimatiellae bacterium]|nr:2-C-methyl-D-erythritol 4-phosphate cytidylyltransferase [Kiritimatiellia bacterium]